MDAKKAPPRNGAALVSRQEVVCWKVGYPIPQSGALPSICAAQQGRVQWKARSPARRPEAPSRPIRAHLSKAYKALPTGGTLIICKHLIDQARQTRPDAL